MSRKKIILFYFLIIFIAIIDQIAKFYFFKKNLPFLKEAFFVSVCNKNIAWGIPVNKEIFILFWILIMIFLVRHFKKTADFYLFPVIIGAFSNIFDRIARGCVVDYVNLYPFPVFNIADVLITIGLFLFIIRNFQKN